MNQFVISEKAAIRLSNIIAVVTDENDRHIAFLDNGMWIEISWNMYRKIMAVMDRMKMSIKNQWIDDKGRVYLIYPMNELEKDAGMSRKRIMEGLQELKDAGLLEQDVDETGCSGIMYLKHIAVE